VFLLSGVIPAIGLSLLVRRLLERPVQHIRTGAQRRKLYPIDQGFGPGAQATMARADLKVRRQMVTLRSGDQMFYQTLAPASGSPSHIVVYLHGYTSHSDMYMEVMGDIAAEGALVITPDLPSHGRSDGIIGYIPDWWQWVDRIWDFMEIVVERCRAEHGAASCKVFVSGMSLGGGLAACLCTMRPTFFDGMILIAPMLYVSDHVKPPWIVQQLFRRLLSPFKLTLPVTPTKPMDDFDFRVPGHGAAFGQGNKLGMLGLKPRLASAAEMGFVFPEWMEERLGQVRTPFLILHGDADKITDPDASKSLLERALTPDKELKLYPGAYHCDLFCCTPGNERLVDIKFLPEQLDCTKQVVQDICAWLRKRR